SLAVFVITAPDSSYSSSLKPEPTPAFVSTNTSWPANFKLCTPAGVIATRFSLFLISFGIPIRIVQFPLQYFAQYYEIAIVKHSNINFIHLSMYDWLIVFKSYVTNEH